MTASWQYDAVDTLPYIDFVSLHRPTSFADMQRQVGEIEDSATPKPILLAGFGISTFTSSEEEQSTEILNYVRYAEGSGLLGWVAWQAFDFPVNRICQPMPCRQIDSASLHEGLWKSNNTAKAIVQDLKLYLRAAPPLLETLDPATVDAPTATVAPTLLTPSAPPLMTETPLPPTASQQTRAVPRPLRL